MIWNGVRSSSGPAWRKTRPCFRNTQTPMASLQLLVQIPTVLRSLYEAAGTEKLTFGDLPPALQACLYDVDILLYPCLFAWTESDGSSVMGLFALMESSGSAINFMDRTVVSRQGIEWPEPIDWTPPDV